MKVQLLKNLIKEAVREVLKEELKEILSESKSLVNPSSSTPTSKVSPLNSLSTSTSTAPYISLEDILNETRQNMSRSDYSNIINESNTVSLSSDFSNNISTEPTVGLDISNLDFVKKAAAVYNLSNKKSN